MGIQFYEGKHIYYLQTLKCFYLFESILTCCLFLNIVLILAPGRFLILTRRSEFDVGLYPIYKQLLRILFRTAMFNRWNDYKIIPLKRYLIINLTQSEQKLIYFFYTGSTYYILHCHDSLYYSSFKLYGPLVYIFISWENVEKPFWKKKD